MKKISFGIVGSGWRSECFLRTAAALGDRMEVSGIVSRSDEMRRSLTLSWGIEAFATAEELLRSRGADFLFVSVSGGAMKQVLEGLFSLGVPLLCETPPAPDLPGLIELNAAASRSGARVQVAEQYWLSPMNSARLALLDSGLIGIPSYAHVSVNHGYHNVSLIRKFLRVGFENAEIRATAFNAPVVGGPGRAGDPAEERIQSPEHILATVDFGPKRALFDFETDQHRSWIRSSRVLVRGERGELADSRVTYLRDFLNPVRAELSRVETGGEDDFEGRYLKGVMLGDRWFFRNETAPARLSDEEIAQARVIFGMRDFVESGVDVYSLADASQDAYLALMIREAARLGQPVRTSTQPWAGGS